jgi:lipopolysaccharide transport system ATP-binding protein
MSDIAIKIENLSKKYVIGAKDNRFLYERISNSFKSLFSRNRKQQETEFWALRDINLEIKQGDVVGIIGKNGAGKSTLLKIISRITQPTTGKVTVKGKVASILEVGTGMNRELTGRENIFINGAILGMKQAEIRRKFDEIVAFSGVEKFIDTPIKHYSSGMYVRLAFAIAAHLEPDILIIDEVLAVGDAEFQKKCLGKMDDISRSEGRTVLFVSHNMGAVRGLCKKAVLLANGKIESMGNVEDVISKYLSNPTGRFIIGQEGKDEKVILEEVRLLNSMGETTQDFKTGDSLTVEVKYFAKEVIKRPFFWIGVKSQYGSLFGANMLIDGNTPEKIEGEGIIRCTFKELPLLPQTYSVWVGARASDGRTLLTKSKEVAFFQINNRVIGGGSEYADIIASDSAPILLPYEWDY